MMYLATCKHDRAALREIIGKPKAKFYECLACGYQWPAQTVRIVLPGPGSIRNVAGDDFLSRRSFLQTNRFK